ncbi:MAG: riboflavin synthase [Blastocatellia bacterium]|nr:MAG: riboflavin synthase [Blastocatellia bacterium]
MFTGLIEATGRLVERRPIAGGFRLRIASSIADQLRAGDSLAVNGVCLTVVTAADGEVHADVGPETTRITTLGTIADDAIVNLERPLRADARFGGHFVQGHVDAIGNVEARRPDATFEWLTVGFPKRLAPFIVLKGSIAVDGVSLTVATLGWDRFDVQVVPYTLEHTNLQGLRDGDGVNLECDLVGKYVVRAAEVARLAEPPAVDVPR